MSEAKIYGLLAEFPEPKYLVHAAEELNKAGYSHVESYSPFSVEGISKALRFSPFSVAAIFLIAALFSAAAGYAMQYYASVISYPENVGGRPLHSWPSFIPITFEMGVLGGVLGGIIGMILLNHLPRYSHPVFNVESFCGASKDSFFLCVEASDPHFHREMTTGLLRRIGAIEVSEVPL